jgi:O-antigen/teichoic acid export membrane protein
MTGYKLFAQRVGLIGITNLLVNLRGLILIPILTKTLGAEGYGIWAQAIVTIALITPLVTLGLSSAMIRFLAAERDKKEIQEGFYSSSLLIFFVSLLASSILFIFSEPIAASLFGGATEVVKLIAVIIPFWNLDTTLFSLFTAFNQMKRYSIFRIAETFGEVGLVAYMVLSGFGIYGAVISILIIRIVIILVMSVLVIKEIGVKIPDFSKLKSYLHFGLPLVPSTIFAWIAASSDRYVIVYFLGIAPVGIYSAAYNISQAAIFMSLAPISFVLVPTLSRLYDDKKIEEVKTHLRYSLKYFLMFAIPVAFGVSTLAKQILMILATSEFVYTGSVVIPFVALSMVLSGIYSIIGTIFILVKKTKIYGLIWGLAALTNLSLNIVLVPYIGILGAAIATLISFAIASAITVRMSFKYLKFEIDWSFIIKSIIAAVIMSLIIWKLNPIGTLNVLVSIGVGAGIYFLILVLLKGIEREEVGFLKSMFGSKI